MRRLLCVCLVLWPLSAAAADGHLPRKVERGIRRAIASGVVAAPIAPVAEEPAMADGPLTPIANLHGRTDGSGYLRVSGGAYSGADGPLTPIGNLRGRTDSNGYLIVSMGSGVVSAAASGTCVTPSYTFTGDTDTGIGYLGANNAAGCANGASTFDWNASRVNFTQKIVAPAGTSAAVGIQIGTLAGTGFYSSDGQNSVQFMSNGVFAFKYDTTPDITMSSAAHLGWGSTTSPTVGLDTLLVRDAAYVIGMANAANPQTFRIYGTTTGPKYLSLGHDGTNAVIDTSASAGTLSLAPTNASSVAIGKSTAVTGTMTASILAGSGTGTSVANVGANSCGTTTATIAGNQVSGVITVGATSGTQCRVTFTTAAPVARDCTVTDSTTTIATRATAVDTSNTDFLGAFVAGDKVTYQCTVR